MRPIRADHVPTAQANADAVDLNHNDYAVATLRDRLDFLFEHNVAVRMASKLGYDQSGQLVLFVLKPKQTRGHI